MQASENKMFTSNYHWLVVDDTNRSIEETMLTHRVELNLESELVWMLESRVFEVYQTGTLPHGRIIITEVRPPQTPASHVIVTE
jgi:hypothetical protein